MKQFERIDDVGNLMVGVFHRLALFGIGAATVWAAGLTFLDIFHKDSASIQDLLLLFIYLELGAMVGIYFKTSHMPVRFLIYIAITALTRHIIDMTTLADNYISEISVLGVTILVLSGSVLVIRYASHNYPSRTEDMP
jgi:phosphate starvation-inducible membrane PsiE